ncbi:MAG TPA: RICIN domain-containing protein, partial [Lachnospiraceae bacterium]
MKKENSFVSPLLFEDKAQREIHSKVFYSNNHGGVIAIYPSAVHYKQGDQFIEIDNSLYREEMTGSLKNRNPHFSVEFLPAQKEENTFIKVAKEGYLLKFGIYQENEKSVLAQIENQNPIEENAKELWGYPKELIRNKHMSKATYPEIMKGVDISYILSGETLKENLVLKSKEALEHSFVFSFIHESLKTKKGSDGSLNFYNEGRLIYHIPAPCMYDAMGNYSKGIYYDILEEKDNQLKVELKVDREWLRAADRAYPIVLDPNTETNKVSKDIADTFIKQKSPNDAVVSTYGSFYVGKNREYGICRSFLKFNKLPLLPSGAIIYDARICVWQYKFSADDEAAFPIHAHRVTSSWSSGKTTWNQAPSFEEKVLDYTMAEPVIKDGHMQIVPKNFHVTNLVRDWYNYPQNNHGIMLKAADENKFSESVFVTSDYPGGNALGISGEQFPCGLIYYKDATGLEDYYSYHSQETYRAGSGFVNDYNGNLVWKHVDATTHSGIMPAILSHVYNLSDGDTWRRVGRGFRLSGYCELKETTNRDYPYFYVDEDGSSHYFYKDSSDGDKLKDEDGLGYILTGLSSSDGDYYYTMEDKEKNKKFFARDGRLTKEQDLHGNKITYTYQKDMYGYYLTKITDSEGYSITLTYTNTFLTKIEDSIGRATLYDYDQDAHLIKVTYPDKKESRFFYNGHKLNRVVDANGYEICYDYSMDMSSPRVCRIIEKGNGEVGQIIKIIYKNGSTTIFEESGLDGNIDSSQDNKVYTYHFDDEGRLLCVHDEEGNANSYEYFREGMKNHKLSKVGSMSKAIRNYLLNTRFEEDLKEWELHQDKKESGMVEVSNDTGYIGNKSLHIISKESGMGKVGIRQYKDLKEGLYTASAYIKTKDIEEGHGGFHISIIAFTNDGGFAFIKNSQSLHGSTKEEINQGWERVSVTFSVSNNYKGVFVIPNIENSKGEAYVTCLQLEEGEVANPFNILENGSFEEAKENAAIPKGYEGISTDNVLWHDGRILKGGRDSEYGLRIYGNKDLRKGFWKYIPISGDENDTFIVSGWAKANAIWGKEFSIVVGFLYTDGSYKWEEIPFHPGIMDWQYVSKAISPNDFDGDTKKSYKAILFHVFFANQINDAYFDDFQIIRDDAESFIYDKNGNLLSAGSVIESEKFAYDKEQNLKKLISAEQGNFEYGQNGKKDLVRAKNTEGISYHFAYDEKGNPTGAVITGSKWDKAVSVNGVYYVRERYSGNYLTLNEITGANTAKVGLNKLKGDDRQKWQVRDAGKGYMTFVSLADKTKALDIYGGNDVDNTLVTAFLKNATDAQKFKLELMEDGSYQILSKCKSQTRGLTNASASYAEGAEVSIWTTNKSYDHQKWYFVPAQNPLEGDRLIAEKEQMCMLKFAMHEKYMDVYGGQIKEGAKLSSYYKHGGDNQRFILVKEADTTVTIRPAYERGFALAVDETTDKILLKPYQAGNVSQRFKVEKRQGGYVFIKEHSKRYLCLEGDKKEQGIDVCLSKEREEAPPSAIFIIEDISEKIETKMTYTPKAKQVATTIDARGHVTTNIYDKEERLLLSTTNAKGVKTEYSYDSLTDKLVEVKGSAGEERKILYSYDKAERLSSISHNGFTYQYGYDNYGNLKSIMAGDELVEEREYLPHNGELKTIRYANGDSCSYVYDKELRVRETLWNGKLETKNTYDVAGNLICHEDRNANLTECFEYDLTGRLTGIKEDGGSNLFISYDEKNRMKNIYESVKAGEKEEITKTDYLYGNVQKGEGENLLYGIWIDGKEALSYSYDDLARIKEEKVVLKDKTTQKDYVKSYTYLPGQKAGTTTTVVETVSQGDITSRYTYDELGNIADIYENGQLKARYTYDGFNQLIKEDSLWENLSITYSYDNGGNLISVKKYKYEEGEIKEENLIKEDIYGYQVSGWKDQMISFNGEKFTYDALGNPISYFGKKLTWSRGRELSKIEAGNQKVQYFYNAQGYRIRKSIEENGKKSEERYILNGSQILAMTKNNDAISFVYDDKGRLFSMKVNGAVYYYLHNLQNDVIGLLDSAGNQVVTYTYDTWGRVLTSEDKTPQKIGSKNPFRYREYFYDEEYKWYYLQSRYYDPSLRRFINADDMDVLEVEQGSLNQYNLYAYCLNNPVNYVDEDGNIALSNRAKVSIGIVATVGAVALTVATGGAGLPVLMGVASSTVSGAAIGYITGGKKGAINGAADGLMWGGIGALGASAVGAIKTIKQYKRLISPYKKLQKASKGLKKEAHHVI